MPAWKDVVAALYRHGPQTLRALAESVCRPRGAVQSALRRARQHGQVVCLDGRVWAAMAWWIERHAALITASLQRMRRRPRADDIQDAVVTLYDMARCHRPTRGMRWSVYVWHWLGRRVYNEGRRMISPASWDDLAAIPASDTTHAVDDRDDQEWMLRGLMTLPPEDVALLWGRYRDDLTYSELGPIGGIGRSRAHQRIQRSVQHLRFNAAGIPCGWNTVDK